MNSSKSLPSSSPRVVALLRDAERLLQRNDLPGAQNAAICALALAPGQKRPRLLLARIVRRRGSSAEASVLLRELARDHADDAEVLSELGASLSETGAFDEAIPLLQRAVSLHADAESWFALALAYDRNNQPEESLQAARQVERLAPNHVGNRYLLARAQTALGQIDEAAASYRQLARLPAEAAKAWFSLLDLKTVPISAAELARLEALERDPRQSRDDRMLAAFALGQAYEAADRLADAMAATTRANRLHRNPQAWDATAHSRYVDALARAFAPAQDATSSEQGEQGEQGEQVIFIVGLPRSGSTLTEQILAAHADVDAASELPYLHELLTEESSRRGQPLVHWAPQASPADWLQLGQRYLQRTARYQSRRRFTDKMPENWPYAGAIRAMLPGARIVGCQRDAVETCWSCYKQLFAPGHIAYSYDLDHLARYDADYRHLWQHWQQYWPQACRSQSYEALVAEPEREIRALLEFCGLPFDPACLEFHKSRRTTRTASAAQVRKPLTATTSRAVRYGELLAPVAEAVARARAARTIAS